MLSNVPLAKPRASRAAVLQDATSLTISSPYVDDLSIEYDLNSQDHIISGYSVLSGFHGEPVCDLLAGDHISSVYLGDDATLVGCPLDAEKNEDVFGEGKLVSATMLGSLIASRGCVYGNVDDPAFCRPSGSKAFTFNNAGPVTLFDRNYNNQMLINMADKWVQPNAVFHGNGFVSDSAEKGYYQDSWMPSDLASDYRYGLAMFNNDSGRGSEQSSSGKSIDCTWTHATCRTSQPSPNYTTSCFLKAIQEMLAEFSRFSLENVDLGSCSIRSSSDIASISADNAESSGNESQAATVSLQRRKMVTKKKQLKALLKMLDEGYNQCLREVHSVISTFHPLAGLYPDMNARFILHTTSFLYKNLKERISAQIINIKEGMRSDSTTDHELAFESSFIHKQWALQQLRRKEHHLWRPQRGLPEQSVSVLRAWMFQNFLHPYPKDSDKRTLAMKSGLTRSQVSNWFINARVRLWKPMIEEMYAEINRRKIQAAENSVRGPPNMQNRSL